MSWPKCMPPRELQLDMMAGPAVQFHWANHVREGEICASCGHKIDYENYLGFVTAQKKIDIDRLDEVGPNIEKFWLCHECGTDVDRLHELGMKRIMGMANGPVGESLEDLMLPPLEGEIKN